MTITLYYSPGACSFAPHVLLEEAGIPYQLCLVNLSSGEQRQPAFAKVNPKGLVPALDTGAAILTEVPAISYYIAGLVPDKQLFPAELETASTCLEWFNWLSTALHAVAFAQLWRPERFVDNPDHFVYVTARGRKNVHAMFEQIEARLPQHAWAVGSTFTVIDPYIGVFYRWGCRIGVDMAGQYPKWTAHMKRLAQRPAVQRTLDQEKISLWS